MSDPAVLAVWRIESPRMVGRSVVVRAKADAVEIEAQEHGAAVFAECLGVGEANIAADVLTELARAVSSAAVVAGAVGAES